MAEGTLNSYEAHMCLIYEEVPDTALGLMYEPDTSLICISGSYQARIRLIQR